MLVYFVLFWEFPVLSPLPVLLKCWSCVRMVYLPCHYKSSWWWGFGLKAPLFIAQLKANSRHKVKFVSSIGSRGQRQHFYFSKIYVLVCVKCVTSLRLCPSDCVYLASVLLGEVQLTPRFTSFHIKASPSRLQKHLWNVCCFFFFGSFFFFFSLWFWDFASQCMKAPLTLLWDCLCVCLWASVCFQYGQYGMEWRKWAVVGELWPLTWANAYKLMARPVSR